MRCGCTAVLGTSTGGWIGSDCTAGASAGGFLADALARGSTGFASAEVLTIGALVSDGTASDGTAPDGTAPDGTAKGARSAAAGGFCTPGITPRYRCHNFGPATLPIATRTAAAIANKIMDLDLVAFWGTPVSKG